MNLVTGHASRPKIGETVNGDTLVVRCVGSGWLIAVVDALGHGPAAAEVADKARQHLERVAPDEDVRSIVLGLHAGLRGSRGAAAMVCVVRDGAVSGCGVGNVDLRVQGSEVPVVLSPGVLGASVRQFRVFQGELHPRSRLVLFSDGISTRFSLDSVRRMAAADASRHLLEQYGHAHDDATVLVADVAIE